MAKRGGTAMPFTVLSFELIGISEASLYWHDEFFMRVETIDGANALADILNRAAALSKRSDWLGFRSDRRDYPAEKIAYAVAKAMGGAIEFESFNPARPARG